MASKEHMAQQPSAEEQRRRYEARSPEEQERRRLARKARRAGKKSKHKAKKAKQYNPPKLPDLNQTNQFVCIDLEQFERAHHHLTEVGITMYDVTADQIKTAHIIVKENYKKRNGRFVADNKDNFSFGNSIVMSLETTRILLQSILDRHQHIVGHDIATDLKFIQKTFGINTSNHTRYNTIKLHKIYAKQKQPRKLSKCCNDVGIDLKAPHNAGNDSHCNMHLFAVLRSHFSKHPT